MAQTGSAKGVPCPCNPRALLLAHSCTHAGIRSKLATCQAKRRTTKQNSPRQLQLQIQLLQTEGEQ
eukprot:15443458-Alexandrium_andersonii.AAC.1